MWHVDWHAKVVCDIKCSLYLTGLEECCKGAVRLLNVLYACGILPVVYFGLPRTLTEKCSIMIKVYNTCIDFVLPSPQMDV